jgi:hypothetical protein
MNIRPYLQQIASKIFPYSALIALIVTSWGLLLASAMDGCPFFTDGIE